MLDFFGGSFIMILRRIFSNDVNGLNGGFSLQYKVSMADGKVGQHGNDLQKSLPPDIRVLMLRLRCFVSTVPRALIGTRWSCIGSDQYEHRV